MKNCKYRQDRFRNAYGHKVSARLRSVGFGSEVKSWLQVGNAWTDAAVDNFGAVFYWWTHALVSDTTFHGVVKNVSVLSLFATFSINLL